MSVRDAWDLHPFERKWFIEHFIEQKRKENESIEKIKRK